MFNSFKRNMEKSLKELVQEPKEQSEITEKLLEQRLMAMPIIFFFFLFLSFLLPYTVKLPIPLFLGILLASGYGMFIFAIPALQKFSIALVSSIHHSSSRRARPMAMVQLISLEGKSTNYAIFDMGGISVNYFVHDGGGRNGYYIVPEGGYIITGGSITILYYPIRFKHNQLPEPFRNALLQHSEYKIGNPVFLALFVDKISAETVKQAFSSYGEINSVNDAIQLIKMAEEHANLSDSYRRKEMIMAAGKMRNSIRYTNKKQYAPMNEEEIDREVREN
jgi:hypothetical protein